MGLRASTPVRRLTDVYATMMQKTFEPFRALARQM